MQIRRHLMCRLMMILTLVASAQPLARGEENFFPSFSDEHTVGLWLFDETDYPYTTLTDASRYEYDLRLMKGGRLVPGRFGNCLKCTPGLDYAVGYSSWKGHIAFTHMREGSGRPGSGLWGPTVAPEKLLNALAGRGFTCEFWLLLMSNRILRIGTECCKSGKTDAAPVVFMYALGRILISRHQLSLLDCREPVVDEHTQIEAVNRIVFRT